MLCIDVSNYTSPLTPEALARWKAAGVGLVIVQSVDPPRNYPGTVTRQQVQACADAGMPWDIYLWLWTHSDARRDMRAKLALLDGLPAPRNVWIDVEDTEAATPADRSQQLREAMLVVDPWCAERGIPRPGIYTAAWYWPTYMADSKEWADRELWDADYDEVPDATAGWQPYGGWATRRIKQYRGTSTLEGIGGIDMNVLSVEEEAEVTTPAEPTEDVASRLTIGLAYVADDLGDQLETEAKRKTVRKTVVRGLVARMRDVRKQFIGERPA